MKSLRETTKQVEAVSGAVYRALHDAVDWVVPSGWAVPSGRAVPMGGAVSMGGAVPSGRVVDRAVRMAVPSNEAGFRTQRV